MQQRSSPGELGVSLGSGRQPRPDRGARAWRRDVADRRGGGAGRTAGLPRGRRFPAERYRCRRLRRAAGADGRPLAAVAAGRGHHDAELGRNFQPHRAPPAEAAATRVFGFDCGPGGMVLDELARRRSAGRESCDRDGGWPRPLRSTRPCLTELLADPALVTAPPRSLGREQYGGGIVDACWARRPPADDLAMAGPCSPRSPS